MEKRESLLYTIEIRFESIFGDDMVFENFLNYSELLSEPTLEKIADANDDYIIKMATKYGWVE